MATDEDRTIGENVVTLRGDMSQKALADAMRRHGHKWSQSTVWSVEKGDRPLKLTEALDLSVELTTDIDRFFEPPVDVMHSRALQRRGWELSRLEGEIREVALNYERVRLSFLDELSHAALDGLQELSARWTDRAEVSAIDIVAPVLASAEAEREQFVQELKDRGLYGGDDVERQEED